MALTTTTLNGAISADQTLIKVTSGTGFGKGKYLRVDDEFLQQTADADASSTTLIPVRRGVNGTVAKAHPTGANCLVGNGDEFTGSADTTATGYPLSGRQRRLVSYSASGAIALGSPGTDLVAVLNGTSGLTMTQVVPTKDMDTDVLTVISNGKAAHTLTFATAIGDAGSGYTVLTFPAGGQVAAQFMACNGIWVALPSTYAGTVTNIDLSIS